MYKSICFRLKLFNFTFNLLKLIFVSLICFIIYFSVKNLFIKKIKSTYYSKKNINTELIIKPILQVNDIEDNNLTYVISDDGLIQNNYNKLTLNNVDLKNDFFEVYSKQVVYEDDVILLKNRPKILFYNNYNKE